MKQKYSSPYSVRNLTEEEGGSVLMPRIPVVMATQHPDSAKKYVSVQQEVDEALDVFTDGRDNGLSYDEYKIDYEGKLTPYHQPSQIVAKVLFQGIIPGKEVFITPRMPSAREETVFRQLMAMMAAIEANYNAQDQMDSPAIVEIINPMTRDTNDLIEARRRLTYLITLAQESLKSRLKPDDIKIIPLFEHVSTLINVDEIVERYMSEVKGLSHMRVFLGRSDPALFSGFVSATIAAKIAICKLHKLSEEKGIPIYPILGVGSLPFRGHLTPDNVKNVVAEYSGCRTITIQSAMRYDYPKEKVKQTIKYLKNELPNSPSHEFTHEEVESSMEIARIAAEAYKGFFLQTVDVIAKISEFIPNQRDRLLPSMGLNYGRSDAALPSSGVPRVIKASASFYSIGLPPEFLGLGSALEKMYPQQLRMLKDVYPSLVEDVKKAAKYLNLKVAERFIGHHVSEAIEKDFEKAKQILDIEIEPDEQYQNLLTLLEPYLVILLKNPNPGIIKDARRLISQMGSLRGALG